METKNTLFIEESDVIWHPYLIYNNVRNEDENVKSTGVEKIHRVVPSADFTSSGSEQYARLLGIRECSDIDEGALYSVEV